MDEFSRDEVTTVVDRIIRDLLEATGIREPPVDAIVLAQRHLGITVCLDAGMGQRGRAQRLRGQRQIFLRPEPTEERHQWTVAHEIGEHFKVRMLERLGIDPGQTKAMAGESLANLFAYRLLVPTVWFARFAVESGYDLLHLKQRFRTASHEVIAWRILDLPEPSIITIVDNDQIYRRRSNAWRVRKQLSEPERQCQRQVSQANEPQVLRQDGWTVHGWPLHQHSWKREVLRSVVDEDATA